MAALEVQNVKRAINRYGTLPKGARIGAYLESLRAASELASGQEVEGVMVDGVEADCMAETVAVSDVGPNRSVIRSASSKRRWQKSRRWRLQAP